jgi:hypothetical protein
MYISNDFKNKQKNLIKRTGGPWLKKEKTSENLCFLSARATSISREKELKCEISITLHGKSVIVQAAN